MRAFSIIHCSTIYPEIFRAAVRNSPSFPYVSQVFLSYTFPIQVYRIDLDYVPHISIPFLGLGYLDFDL
jgi:hypothetical protein